MKKLECKEPSIRRAVINKDEGTSAWRQNSQYDNKSDVQVPGMGYHLSVVFYTFYLKMGCPRLKVIKCSKFEQNMDN